jgi:glyoxylase-like metal-dependent hydrolase (beta-lactamase superfamily II)
MKKKIECVVVGAIQTNCWLYALEDDSQNGKQPCVVIDPGDEAALIVSRLGELNWVPRFIFLTHGHFDHLAALPFLSETFENTKIGIHKLDAKYLGKDSLKVHYRSISAAGGNPSFVDALWKPLPEAGLFFGEGDKAGPFTILHLPGHTPGSVGFYDEKAGVLFSGDTLFKGTWGRTDLPGGSDAEIYKSLERLLSMRGEIIVCPGHGPATTIMDEAGLLGN